MTTFLDGEAKDQKMELRRCPLLLRVTIGPDGKFDALDELDDAPEDNERIIVYRRMEKPLPIHVLHSGGRGQWLKLARYRLSPAQPAEFQARDQESWQQWCREQTGAVSEPSFL